MAPPAIRPGGIGTSRMMASAVMLLPQPDSPTMPSVRPAARSKLRPSITLRDRAVLEIEFDRQSLDLEQRAHRCLSFGLKASFRPSPIRLTDSTVMKMARPGKVTGHQASRICGRLTLIR